MTAMTKEGAMTTDKLRELLAGATPGPWDTAKDAPANEWSVWSVAAQVRVARLDRETDAALIVALRNNAEALLDIAEKARDVQIAQERMLGRWAEGDDDVKRELWQNLHRAGDELRLALDRLEATQR
jgi:hypothetical protein